MVDAWNVAFGCGMIFMYDIWCVMWLGFDLETIWGLTQEIQSSANVYT